MKDNDIQFRWSMKEDGSPSGGFEQAPDDTDILKFTEGLIYGILIGSVFWAAVIWVLI